MEKLNVQLRKIAKEALGIPNCTSTERLMELGLHNTLEEIAEAQQRTQITTLSNTRSGRALLQEADFDAGMINSIYADHGVRK